MKKIVLPLTLGVVVLGFMALFMIKVSMDFRLVLTLSSILLFLSGLLVSHNSNTITSALFISVPYSLVFSYFLYSQIPSLICFVLFYILAAWYGLRIKREPSKRNLAQLSGFIVLITCMDAFIIPSLISKDLTDYPNQKVEPFTMYNMSKEGTESTALKNKVVVVDFMGTWCKPCILELRELDKVQEYFNNDPEVEFYVINSSEAGDTPEKMNKFISNNDYDFNYGFDYDQQLVKQFGLRGVPYLFIFDKHGKLRYKHVGYNPGESDFSKKLIETIKELKSLDV